jgi:hypothetical protein
MSQTLELTAAELALIENARKQEVLAKEAKALQDAARLEKEIIDEEAAIRREQNNNNAQVDAAIEFEKQLKKLNPNYKLVKEEKEVIRQIKGGSFNDKERPILKEFKYIINQVHITLDGTPFKVDVKKHFVYGNSWSTRATDKGYKMQLIGGGFYNERLLSNPKTLNKKIEDTLLDNKNRADAKIKKADAVEYVFENLSNLYPDAVITKGTEWQRNNWDKNGGETIDKVEVKLANGIKIKYRVFSDKSLSRMEITFPVKDSYQLLEVMNGLSFPEVIN